MRCQNCGIENAAGSRFCNRCGTPLNKRCPKCGSENTAKAIFCSQCGAAIDAAERMCAAEPGGGPAEPRGSSLTGERRHLTVLFCDLVNSTSLAAQLDPEEWREIVADYHRTAAQAIERFGGHVAKYLGDGVMAFFGYPEAHDNDAERAARAGLAILDAIAKLIHDAAGSKLAARIGIDSGAVVVGTGANAEIDVFGETPNIAARIQSVAEPGTVVVSADTHKLITGLFIVDDQGPLPLRGIAEPLRLYRIIQPSGVRGRFEAMAISRGLTPFVGRDKELRTLAEIWERARNGQGQTALIIGEAGIGKSRLLHQFRQIIGQTSHAWIESGAGVFFQNTPFHAVAEMLRQTLVSNGDLQDGVAKKLSRAGLDPRAAVLLLAPLIDLPITGKYPASALPPDEQRRRLIAILLEWILRNARDGPPHIIAVEDLHWADPSTLEFLRLLGGRASEASLLQIYTARPEFDSSWQMQADLTQIKLSALSNHDVRSMVVEVAAQNRLADETLSAVVERTAGVPLFVEELTRALVENGGDGPASRTIPATLHDSLMARLDQLGAARETLQIGAVLGNEFSYELLREIHPLERDELERRMRALTDAELLYVQGKSPERKYQFKHALIRDAAYEALLKSRRKELHQSVAALLTSESSPRIDAPPELIAHHCTEAALVDQAIRYWALAGQMAVQRSANIEARAHFLRGLTLLNTLPSSSERILAELKLQIALTNPLIATKGYTDPEVETASNRALELCQQLGEVPELFAVLGALISIYYNRSELGLALELGKQMLRIAEVQHQPELLLWAHYTLSFSLSSLGKLKAARSHLSRSISFYDTHKAGSYGYVQDPGPTAMAMQSQVIHALGYPDQALRQLENGLDFARTLSHPFTLAWVLGFAGNLYWRRGDKAKAQDSWNEQAALSRELGFKPFLESASFSLGFALAESAEANDGIAKMQEVFARLGTIDGLRFPDRVRWMAFLGLALGKAGQAAQGMAQIEHALELGKQTSNPRDLCNLFLFKGRLCLMLDSHGIRKPRQCFSEAIRIAREMGAKSDELTAVLEMAKLLIHQNRRAQARAVLSKIYNWFTEGFDTADLKEAKALLDELSA
jgi:class 3 adenylate cyclase/tetratricopeptide (TPR) repeat protein